MTPLRSTRRALASSASLFVPGSPSPGTGCILCLWGSGKNELQPVSVPGGGTCHTMRFTPMSVPWMSAGSTSLMRHLGPHPGHLSLVVSRPDDPTIIQYLSLGGDNLHKRTSLLSAAPDLSLALSADVANFQRMPDYVLNISFIDQQPVYDWIYDFQQNKDTKRYHMLGLWGYSCATACREALMAGSTEPFIRRRLPVNALLTPQWVFDEAQRFQMATGVAQDTAFLEKQMQDAISFHDYRVATVSQGIKDISAMLNSSLSISDPNTQQRIYKDAEDRYNTVFPWFIGVHPEFQLLPPHQPLLSVGVVAVIQALGAISVKEAYIGARYRQNYIDQIRTLTYNEIGRSGPPNP